MKNRFWTTLSLALLTLAVLGCQNPLGQSAVNGAQGQGQVVLSLDAAFRTLTPGVTLDPSEYKVTFEKDGLTPVVRTLVPGTTADPISLNLGTWTIAVEARNASGHFIGRGSGNVTIEAGVTKPASVTIQAIDGTGTVKAGMTVPSGKTIELSLTPAQGGTAQALSFSTAGGVSSAVQSLNRGYYTAEATLKDGASVVARAFSAVLVLATYETKIGIHFADGLLTLNTTLPTPVDTVAAPTFSPAPGQISSGTNIALASATAGATIYYTTDGAVPTAASSVYTAPFPLTIAEGASVTVRAIAVKNGLNDSAVSSGTYSVPGQTFDGIRVFVQGFSEIHYWSVVANPPIANSVWGQNPLLLDHPTGWKYFELPKATSTNLLFKNPGQTADLSRTKGEWWWYQNAWHSSDPLKPVVPEITADQDTTKRYNAALLVKLSSSNADDKVYYTLDGSTPSESSTLYTSAGINLTPAASPRTLKAVGVNTRDPANKLTGAVFTFTYDINSSYDLTPPAITPTLEPKSYPTGQSVQFNLTDNVGGITAYYTTNGTAPTTSSTLYATTTGTSGTGATLSVSQTTKFRFLVIDTAGNRTEKSFNYFIGESGRGDFREETIYFLMTTRFYDGDPSNNFFAWDDAKAGNVANNDPAWRGDFKGLIEKLDYIKALGFSAVWITPVVKNMSGYDYHGYHAVNHSVVDPRYESADTTYQDLINAAHARGMKIVQDVVVNHTGNFGEENLHPLFVKDASGGYKNWLQPNLHEANALLEQGAQVMGGAYSTLTPGNQFQARIKALRAPLDVNVHYHNHEFKGGWEQYEVQIGSIAGDCQDLNTENPVVAAYLRDAYIGFINMGVDAFRVDTVKHISRLTFNNEFIPQWKQAGGENFFIFGEVATRYRSIWNDGKPAISTPFYTWNFANGKSDSTYAWGDRLTNEQSVITHYNDNISTSGQPSSDNHLLINNTYRNPDWSKRSGMDVIDFPMHWAFNSIGDAWATAVGGDWAYSDATFNVTYIDSHDYAPDGAPENKRYVGSWPEKLSLIFTFRGIPTLYYGSEIEFKKGAVIDVGPNAPLENTGRAYFGNHITGSVTVSDFGKYSNATGAMAETLSHPLATHIRALNLIRRAVPALQKGQYSVNDVNGAMAFRRRYTDADTDSFALVALDGSATFSNVPNGTYRDVVTGQSHTVSNGTATLGSGGTGNLRVWVLYGGDARRKDPGHVLQGLFPLAYIK